MRDLTDRWLLADLYQAPSPDRLDVIPRALVGIDGAGMVHRVLRPDEADYLSTLDAARAAGRLDEVPEGQYLIPGFVDLHVHAPQYPQLGLALDVPLEVWLQHYTFPLEARYTDLDFARHVYDALVRDLLDNGTTTALYFATVDQAPTRLLVDLCLALGQRALVGKVVMDDPLSCPDYYRDADADTAVAETRALIDYIRTHPENGADRVLPVITPRFIPACTDAALAGLGALAAECGCHVQTHCSESDWAHGHVLDRHGRSDAASLDAFGLMTRKTVLAHANFLSEGDMDIVAARGAGIAHCPLSNAFFANAVFPLRRALEKGLHVGLGSDISGGPTASILETAKAAVVMSRMLESGTDPALPPDQRGRPAARIDFVTAFHLATAGGGVILDLPIGLIAPRYRFDAMVIDPTAAAGSMRLLQEATPVAHLQRVINTAGKGNIAKVWVDGKLVGGSDAALTTDQRDEPVILGEAFAAV